jgi:hypothetical protein
MIDLRRTVRRPPGPDLVRQGVKAPAKDGHDLFGRAGDAVEGHGVSPVGSHRLKVGKDFVDADEGRKVGKLPDHVKKAHASGRISDKQLAKWGK